MTTFFDDIKGYVGFGPEDSAVLRAFGPLAAPHFESISEHFYACILKHPNAHASIRGGRAQVERLKRTLVEWMRSGLEGPHDRAFYERRARIGRIHVQIDLPQQYMLTAMNVVRLDFRHVVAEALGGEPERERRLNDAIDKLFDLELAIMLRTYQEDSEERLRRREQLATIGQVAASIGHDLRNPLGVIDSSLYILRKRVTADPRAGRHVERIAEEVGHCGRVIDGLLGMARQRPPRVESVELGALVQLALGDVQVPPNISVQSDVGAEMQLRAEPRLVRQALVNLIGNAVQALAGTAGTIAVRAEKEEGAVKVSVEDSGPGFDPEIMGQAFEPLVTGRTTGTGLGLALVQRVATMHGGRVAAANRPEGGAVVTIWLPEHGPDGQGSDPVV